MIGVLLTGWLTMTAGAAEPASCSKDSPMIGYEAVLDRRQHQVGGRAVIVDDCTVEIRNFTYDGRGIDVRIYGAKDGAFRKGFAMTGDLVRRRPYTGDTLVARLPAGKSWSDVTHLSVWCVDFDVDFGSGQLRKP